MGLLNRIASIFVDIRAPDAQLRSDLRTAENDVHQSAARMGQAASGATGAGSAGAQGFANSLKAATKPARDIMSAIVGTVGILTRALGIIGLITSAAYGLYRIVRDILTASERAKEESLKGAQSLLQFRERLRESLITDPVGKVAAAGKRRLDDALKSLEIEEDIIARREKAAEIQKDLDDLRRRFPKIEETQDQSNEVLVRYRALQRTLRETLKPIQDAQKEITRGFNDETAVAIQGVRNEMDKEFGELSRPLDRLGSDLEDALLNATDGFHRGLTGPDAEIKLRELIEEANRMGEEAYGDQRRMRAEFDEWVSNMHAQHIKRRRDQEIDAAREVAASVRGLLDTTRETFAAGLAGTMLLDVQQQIATAGHVRY